MMTDQKKHPTKQMRRIDCTQEWFTMQECWKRIIGDIQYIDTRDNPADGLTKKLGRILHSDHVYRAMGLYCSCPYKFGSYKNSHEKNNCE